MRSYLQSLILHLGLVCAIVLALGRHESLNEVPIELVDLQRLTESPRPAPALKRPVPSQPPTSTTARSDSASTSANQSAPGNALVSGPSTGNQESVAEEYEVGELPMLMNEVRIPYPPQARAKGIQGGVLFELLVSSDGTIKELKAIESPDPELTAAASNAVKNFRFRPARIADKPVAIRIRYTYRFILK